MARKRGRRAGLAAVGLLTAGTPLVLGAQPAGAAETFDEDEVELTIVTESGGDTIECFAHLTAIHDTDDADQPTFDFGVGVGGDTAACIDTAVTMTASYKDQDGITRTTTVSSTGGPAAVVQGAYTNTTVTAEVFWSDCDTTVAVCEATLTASPK